MDERKEKAFGIRTGGGKNTLYARRVREAIDDPMLLAMTEPLLIAYEDGLRTLAVIDKMVLDIVKKDAVCRLLMTVPGVGPVTAPASMSCGASTVPGLSLPSSD